MVDCAAWARTLGESVTLNALQCVLSESFTGARIQSRVGSFLQTLTVCQWRPSYFQMPMTGLHLAKLSPALGRAAAAISLGLALTGCQSIAGSPQFTQVRYIDASPDAPALDVYQNSTVSLYNVGFGTVSSYIPLTPGGYNYSVDVAGTQQQLETVRGTFTLGNQYTVLVSNVAANLQMSVLQDQSAPAASGQVALRFLDEATRVGAVDIYLIAPGGQLAMTAPVLSKVSFGNAPVYVDVPSGAYSIIVLPTGTSTTTTTTTTTTSTGTTTTTTTTTNSIPTLYSGNQITYPGASVRTILLVDQPLTSPAGVQVVSADDYDSPSAN